MLCMVKMPLKGEVGSCALNSHGNYIVDHGKSWKNHGIVFLNFYGNPDHNNVCINLTFAIEILCTIKSLKSWGKSRSLHSRSFEMKFMILIITSFISFIQGCHGQGKSSGKWKIIFQVREKSGNYIFSRGNLKRNEKSHGKVREFQNFPKKMLVNRLLEILVSIICKQY